MQVVLDTNVLVSATISDGPPYRILELVETGALTAIVSPAIIAETRDVLTRDRIPVREQHVDLFVQKIRSVFDLADPGGELTVIGDDPEDDKILECAVSAGADYIISGDSHLLVVGNYDDISIVSPREFLEEIVER